MKSKQPKLLESLSAAMDGEASVADVRVVLHELAVEGNSDAPDGLRQQLQNYAAVEERMSSEGGASAAPSAHRDISAAVMRRIRELPPEGRESASTAVIQPGWRRVLVGLRPGSLMGPMAGLAAGFVLVFSALLMVPAQPGQLIAATPSAAEQSAEIETSDQMLASLEQVIAASPSTPVRPEQRIVDKSAYPHSEAESIELQAGYELEKEEK